MSLLSHEPPLPPHVLSAALLRRAVTDVDRVVQIRDAKAALSTLLQKSLIGDAFWNEFLEAEKELEAEIREVVEEANTFNPNWGKFIFAQASDIAQHEKFKNTAKELSTPLPRVQLVQQQPNGQPPQGAAAGGAPSPQPQLPPNFTPEHMRKLEEAASKLPPEQRAAFDAQYAKMKQAQAAAAATAAGGSNTPGAPTEASKSPLTTSAQNNQESPSAGEASQSATPAASGGQNKSPATPSKGKVSSIVIRTWPFDLRPLLTQNLICFRKRERAKRNEGL